MNKLAGAFFLCLIAAISLGVTVEHIFIAMDFVNNNNLLSIGFNSGLSNFLISILGIFTGAFTFCFFAAKATMWFHDYFKNN